MAVKRFFALNRMATQVHATLDKANQNGVSISLPGSIGARLLFSGRAGEYVPVLSLTTSRHVLCEAKIAPVTVLARAARQRRLLLSKRSFVIVDAVQVHAARGK
ncbi:MAG: hypothetical protein ABI767_08460 [Rhodanobacter sp.]